MSMSSAIRYKNLLVTTKVQPPYRGTTNEYPVTNRRHSYKRMKALEVTNDKGEKEMEFHIHYGYKYKTSLCTEEEYKEIRKSGAAWPRVYESDTHKDDGTIIKEYYKCEQMLNLVGIVRSDNTFEFAEDCDMHQGTRMFLSTYGCFLRQSSKHGGVVICKGYNTVQTPVFAGLRIYMDTLMPHPTSDYEITKRTVNRSAGAKEMKKYEKAFTIAEVMLSATDRDSFISQAKEIAEEIISQMDKTADPRNLVYRPEFEERLDEEIPKVMDEDPLGAIIMCMLLHNIYHIRSYINRGMNAYMYHYLGDVQPIAFFNSVKNKFARQIYLKAGVFDETVIKAGESIPSSNWPLVVKVNGKEVKQYQC